MLAMANAMPRSKLLMGLFVSCVLVPFCPAFSQGLPAFWHMAMGFIVTSFTPPGQRHNTASGYPVCSTIPFSSENLRVTGHNAAPSASYGNKGCMVT